MRETIKLTICIILLSGPGQIIWGQKAYPPEIECDREFNFKTVNDTELKLWVFLPPKHRVEDSSAAIVFFFGGGWRSGNPSQFTRHSEYLAARGMVAMVSDYRVASRHGVLANACVSDAKSAIRWVRQHASELGVDPDRIAAGGGSAGGHLALATATLPGFDEPGENPDISSKPDALVLFNPAVILAPVEGSDDKFADKLENLKGRLGTDPESISPYHHITPGLPPVIIFHGEADTTVPFETVSMFTREMKRAGNNCTLVGFKGESHGFFNYGRDNNGSFVSTVHRMDNFLVSLGYLTHPPELFEQ